MIHHAYLLGGSREKGLATAFALHSLSEEQRVGNPDLHVLSYINFGIDDARQLAEWAIQNPIREERRVFVLLIESMLHEAQNALLKLFEEPPEKSAFVLVVPDTERMLPTLRSRFEIITLEETAEGNMAEKFLSLTQGERLKEIAARVKEKDTVWIGALLTSLEAKLYAEKKTAALLTLLFVRNYIHRRGASPKMLLEHLVLAL